MYLAAVDTGRFTTKALLFELSPAGYSIVRQRIIEKNVREDREAEALLEAIGALELSPGTPVACLLGDRRMKAKKLSYDAAVKPDRQAFACFSLKEEGLLSPRIEFRIAGKEERREHMVVVGAEETFLLSLEKAVRTAGCLLQAILPLPFSVYDLVLLASPELDFTSSILVDMAYDETRAYVFRNGIFEKALSLEGGSSILTSLLAEKRKISLADAEEVKKKIRLLPLEFDENTCIEECTQDLRTLESELHKLAAWFSRLALEYLPGEKDAFYLFGGGSALLDIELFLENTVGKSVRSISTLIRRVSPHVVDPSLIAAFSAIGCFGGKK